nr:hypothetical protein TgIb.0060c [Toxoplasma gondii RH]
MVNLPSSAAAAFFALCFCDMGDSSIRSQAVAANASDSVTVIAGKADDSGAAFVASSPDTPGEAEQQLAHANIILKSVPNKKATVALHHTKTMNAVTALLLLTGVVGLLLASVKLHKCWQDLLRNSGRGLEGNTVRRLAEGGVDKDKCLEEVRSDGEGAIEGD